MNKYVGRVACLVALVAMTCVNAAQATPRQQADSNNLRLVANYRFDQGGGNEIDFDGDLVYVGQYAGPGDVIRVFRLRGKRVTHLADVPCGGHNDMAALDDGYMAISFQGAGLGCGSSGGPASALGVGTEGGVQVIDVSNPHQPRYHETIAIPGGTHTLTRLPGAPYVYASLGGADTYAAYGGEEHIIDVSDPQRPKVAATYRSALNPSGCHDVAFAPIDGRMIGFCPGLGGTEIWDMKDPEAPAPIGRLLVPFGQLPHNVAVSSDGNLLAVSDEAYAAHGCTGNSPVGAIWFYDISDLDAPQLEGYIGPPRGGLPVGSLSGNPLSCTAHNFNFIPSTKLLVASWISGGMNVIDASDPAAPEEVAHYREQDSITMSSYWYRGLIFTGDFGRGVDILELDPAVLAAP